MISSTSAPRLAAAALAVLPLVAGCRPEGNGDAPVGSSLRYLSPPPAHRLVVATLRNRLQPLEEDPDGILLAQLLQLLLARYPDIDVYPADQSALLELQGRLPTDPSGDEAAAILHLTGAETVLTGELDGSGDALAVELHLGPSSDGARQVVSRTGPASDPLAVAQRLAAEVRRRLTGDESPADATTTEARGPRPEHLSVPRQPEALRALAEGRRRLWLSDAAAAAELLAQAVAGERERPLPHLELARALHAIGSLGGARKEATRAVELGAGGSDDAHLEARALAALLEGAPRAAAELQRQRVEERPWASSPRFALVHALLEARDGRAAFSAIAELRSLPLGAVDRLRIELLAARAARVLGDAAGWLLLAESAEDRAAEIGLPLYEAQASLSVAEAQLALRHPERARESAERARELFLRLSHRRHGAMALAVAAVSDLAAGGSAQARALLRQAAEELRQERDAGNRATVLHNLALVALRTSDLATAEPLLRESLEVRRSLADSVGAAECLLRLAEIEHRRARQARDLHAEALALLEDDGLSPQEGAVALELAAHLAAARDLETSRATREQVRDVAIEAGDPTLEARARSDLAESLLARGELGSARHELERALSLFATLADAQGADRSRLLLAGLSSEEGRFGEAAALAEQVVGSSIESGDRGVESMARSILAWSHHELGRERAAADHMELARQAAEGAADPTVRLSVALAAARLEAATGGDVDSRRELESILAEARARDFVHIALESELALAEIELQRGESDAARRRLQEIAATAERVGWSLLADRARRAAGDLDDS